MSQYFVPPRQPAASQPASSSNHVRVPVELHLDIEPTIYIFPNPPADSASEPWSPDALSSAVSVPTDITTSSTTPSSARSRRRTSSHGSRLSWDHFDVNGRSFSVDPSTRGSEFDVEVWEWTEYGSDNSSGVEIDLAAAVERASRWDLVRRQQPLVDRFPPTEVAERHLQYRRRLRTMSLSPSWDGDPRTRRLSNKSGLSSRARSPVPHPPLRIPLLSFFSSLLSLDDSTLHLLTHPALAHSSALFPGPQLRQGSSVDDDSSEKGIARDEPNFSESELHALKKGLAVACDASVNTANVFAFPTIDIWGIVSGVWRNTGKVWSEAWLPPPATTHVSSL